jgi:sec-independent protein translocase protein TatC
MFNYLKEIKNRIFLLLINLVVSLIVFYLYKEILLFLILDPFIIVLSTFSINKDFYNYFIFTNITEVFLVYFDLLFFLVFQFFVISIIYHLYSFLSFAMFKKEYEFLCFFIKSSLFIWLISLTITTYIVIPFTWKFFLSYQTLTSIQFFLLHFEAKLKDYLEFYISSYYICIFYFQIFTILFLNLNYFKTDLLYIKKFRKLYYFLFLLISTIISPPDIFTQLFLTVFCIMLFESFFFSILFKQFLLRRQQIKANKNPYSKNKIT